MALARWGRGRGMRMVSSHEMGFPPEVFPDIPERLLRGAMVDSQPYRPAPPRRSGGGAGAVSPHTTTAVGPVTPTDTATIRFTPDPELVELVTGWPVTTPTDTATVPPAPDPEQVAEAEPAPGVEPEAEQVTGPPPQPEPEPEPETVAEAEPAPGPEAEPSPPAGGLRCGEPGCGYAAGSARGLRVHQTKAHGGGG